MVATRGSRVFGRGEGGFLKEVGGALQATSARWARKALAKRAWSVEALPIHAAVALMPAAAWGRASPAAGAALPSHWRAPLACRPPRARGGARRRGGLRMLHGLESVRTVRSPPIVPLYSASAKRATNGTALNRWPPRRVPKVCNRKLASPAAIDNSSTNAWWVWGWGGGVGGGCGVAEWRGGMP